MLFFFFICVFIQIQLKEPEKWVEAKKASKIEEKRRLKTLEDNLQLIVRQMEDEGTKSKRKSRTPVKNSFEGVSLPAMQPPNEEKKEEEPAPPPKSKFNKKSKPIICQTQ